MNDGTDHGLEMLNAEYCSIFHYHADRYRKMLQTQKCGRRFWVDGNQTRH